MVMVQKPDQMQNAAEPTGRHFLTQPGHNCWRIETAGRAVCLVDGEGYFSAAKQALLTAIIHQVRISAVGWLPSGWDGAPAQAGPASGL